MDNIFRSAEVCNLDTIQSREWSQKMERNRGQPMGLCRGALGINGVQGKRHLGAPTSQNYRSIGSTTELLGPHEVRGPGNDRIALWPVCPWAYANQDVRSNRECIIDKNMFILTIIIR